MNSFLKHVDIFEFHESKLLCLFPLSGSYADLRSMCALSKQPRGACPCVAPRPGRAGRAAELTLEPRRAMGGLGQGAWGAAPSPRLRSWAGAGPRGARCRQSRGCEAGSRAGGRRPGLGSGALGPPGRALGPSPPSRSGRPRTCPRPGPAGASELGVLRALRGFVP